MYRTLLTVQSHIVGLSAETAVSAVSLRLHQLFCVVNNARNKGRVEKSVWVH